MSIWLKNISVEDANKHCENTMVSFLGIKITEINDDHIVGTMPVNETTKQPFGILHGGANCVLAETLGSLAANFTLDYNIQHAVGLSITTNHVKAVRNGLVIGIATPKHIGRSTQVWEINSYNEAEQLTSTTSLTMSIVQRK